MIHMPFTVLLGGGSQSNTTHMAVLDIVLQNEALSVQVAIMHTLPCLIGMLILGKQLDQQTQTYDDTTSTRD